MDTSTINFYKGNHKYEVSADELATEIAQCLQIENLNFLIGAGCSSYRDDTGAEKAIPTMAGLAREFYDCNPDLKVDRKNAAKDLFPNNLEALINYLISLKNITTSEKSRKALSGKISIINKFIFERVCNTPYSKELIQLYKEFYLRIVKKTRQVPVNIFTTNYDLYSENALDELGIMYNNGFLGSAQRIFNPNSYNYVVVENLGLSRDVWKSVSNFINLYKIHGSINWLKDDNSGSDTPHILEKDIELILITTPTWHTYYERLDTAQLKKSYTIIHTLQSSHPRLRHLDFLKDKRFEADDFYDADHLSELGAAKLTKYIIQSIRF